MCETQITNCLFLCCAIIGAIVGVVGLFTWRKQIKGNAHFETARNLARSAYSFHETFLYLRSRFMYASDLPIDEETGQRSPRVDLVYGERLRLLSDKMVQLDSALLEAKVLWGKEIDKLINEYRSIMSLIRSDFIEFCQTSETEQTKYTHQQAREARNKFLGNPDGSDDMYNRVEAARDEVISTTEKYLHK